MANGQYANGNNEQYGAVVAGGGSELPSGAILMWAGTVASIPSGYAFCNGLNGTPDLRNRFIVCAQTDSSGVAKANPDGGTLVQSGGSASHEHWYTSGDHTHGIGDVGGCAGGSDYSVGELITMDAYEIYTTDPENTAPPFFALAYIMKL